MYNEIKIYGTIGVDVIGINISSKIDEIALSGAKEIHVRVCSEGGSVMDGIMIVGSLLKSGLKIITYNDGYALSMGAIIFSVGDRRIMTPFSKLMNHEPHIAGRTSSQIKDKKTKKALEQFTDMLTEVLMIKNNKSKEEIKKILSDETWYGAEESLKNGFATEMVTYPSQPEINNEMSNEQFLLEIAAHYEIKSKKNKMENLKNHLGFDDEATENDLIEKVKALEIEASKVEGLNKDLVETKKSVENAESKVSEVENELSIKNEELEVRAKELENEVKKVEALNSKNSELETKLSEIIVNNAIAEGKFESENKEILIEKCKKDIEGFVELLGSIKVQRTKIVDQLEVIEATGKDAWNIEDWQKNDPEGLSKMLEENPSKYKKLYNEFYKN